VFLAMIHALFVAYAAGRSLGADAGPAQTTWSDDWLPG
jgi:hypothetical protein